MSRTICYDRMKPSQEKWIGQIPDTWRLLRLKRIFSIKKNIAGKEGYMVLSVTQRGIRPKAMSEKGQFAKDYSKYQLVNQGDFVMNHMDLLTGWVDISPYDGVTSPDYRVFVNSNPIEFNSEYYRYIFQLCYSARIFYGLGQGVAGFGRWRLPADMFLNFTLPVPPKDEQRMIATYLDDKVSQIDSIIEEEKASIEEYKKWKASVISEMVLGLHFHNDKKQSGVEWVELIPCDWNTVRLKALFNFSKGLPITKENLVDEGVPVISYGQIHAKFNPGTKIISELFRYVPSAYLQSNPESLVHEGDILIADTSEDKEGCGNAVYVDRDMELFAGYHTIILKAKNKKDNKYLSYLFKTDAWRSQIRTRVSGVKLFSISKKILNSVSVILPPTTVQAAIVEELDKKCGEIDSIIAEKETLILDLEKYKRSLIYDAVTGKRKVV